MWEVIFGVIPLIFVCSTIVLILINFDAVAEYFIYTFANISRKKHARQQTCDPATTENQPSTSTRKFSLNPLQLLKNIFIRIFNLFTAIFLPKISLDLSFPSKTTPRNDPENNYLAQIAQNQVKQLNIKSYSAMPTSLANITVTQPDLPTINITSSSNEEIILPKQKQQISNDLPLQIPPIQPKPTSSTQESIIYAPITSKKINLSPPLILLKNILYHLVLSTPLFLIVTIIVLYILERNSGSTNANLLEWLTNEITTFVENYLNSTN
jgi:hypothetical protein